LALSVKELLAQYFQKPELQEALDEIGESVTGTNSELITRILKNWFKKNRTIRQLLEMLPEEVLADICSDFGLSNEGEIETLIRRILKNSIIDLPGGTSQPSSKVSDKVEIANDTIDTRNVTQRPPSQHHHYGIEIRQATKKKSFKVIIIAIGGVLIALGGVIAFINGAFEFTRNVMPVPSASALLTIDVISPDANLMIDQKPYMIQFAPEIASRPIDGEVTMVINNIGNAPARNVNIEFLHEPQVNNWYDHRTTVVVHGAVQDRGSNQGYQGTLKTADTIEIKYLFTIHPELYPEANLSSPTLTFHVTYDDNGEVLKQYLVCFDDCAQKLANS
jgi:uncharacterized protein YjiS (DUF1127 family)